MPRSFKIGEVLSVIRDKLEMSKEEGLVLLAAGKYMLKQSSELVDVYNKYGDEDGFLYLLYAEENIYG